MSGAIIVTVGYQEVHRIKKTVVNWVFSGSKKKKKRCTSAWTFSGHSAKEIDKLRPKFVPHAQKI